MSAIQFGFDLGTNSIGWAVVNESKREILGMGTSIFQMGVKLEKGTKEVSRNETRREKRQIRRQLFRRRIRKTLLTKYLISHGMFPDIDKLYDLYSSEKKEIKFDGKFKELISEVKLCPELRDFFSLNPYELRARAFEGQKLSKLELGRILYQFALRRGYRETLQDDADDSGAIYQGKPGEGKVGITETAEKIKEWGSLGNYLYHLDPHKTRIRNRYTLRSMYTQEFDEIFKNQHVHYPEILTDEFYQKVGFRHQSDLRKNGILFYQRPLRSQKHLIGKCQYEKSKPLAPKSSLEFEVFRAWTFATNIRKDGRVLEDNDMQKVVDFLLAQSVPKKFGDLYKKLSEPLAQYNYDKDDKLPVSTTHANFKKIFKAKWEEYSEKEREDLWHLKYWATDPCWLEKKLAQTYGLDGDQIKSFKKFRIDKGYSSMSRKALKNITSFMQLGYPYDEAVLLAGVRKALGKKWDDMPASDRSILEDNCIAIAKDGTEGNSTQKVASFLQDYLKLTETPLKKMYHHSLRQVENKGKYLGEPENVRNPIVSKSLHQLRKVYNALVDEFGAPSSVHVELARDLKSSKEERANIRKENNSRRDENIELKAILDKYNQPHTSENIQKLFLYKEIEKRYGRCVNPFKPSETIGLQDLFGSGYVQVEHIIPYSISLNNSIGNKTLCDADTNRAKGNFTPYQYYKSIGADWESIKNEIFKILPYQKAKRFISEKNEDAEDFISRQLNDTRYISRYAVNYLRGACDNVQIMQGMVSSLLRHHWGLDTILNPPIHFEVEDGEYLVAVDEANTILKSEPFKGNIKVISEQLAKTGKVKRGHVKNGRFYSSKDRDDHRHHAIDALVVALAKRGHLQQLSRAHAQNNGYADLKNNKRHIIERPWDSLWVDTKKIVDAILVHHEQNNKVLTKVKKRLFDETGKPRFVNGKPLYSQGLAARGSLHEETFYGRHTGPDGKEYYHIRKAIDTITDDKSLNKIVDSQVREQIKLRFKTLGVNVENPKGWSINELSPEVRKSVFYLTDAEKKNHPQIFMPNRNGAAIPIKKVRQRKVIGNAEQVKNSLNQYVDPKNNHHILISVDHIGNPVEEVVSFWTAVERAKQKQSIYQVKTGYTALFTMEVNDCFLLQIPQNIRENWLNLDKQYLSQFLYRVQQLSSKDYMFRKNTASTLIYNSQMVRITSLTGLLNCGPIKVRVSEIGQITPW